MTKSKKDKDTVTASLVKLERAIGVPLEVIFTIEQGVFKFNGARVPEMAEYDDDEPVKRPGILQEHLQDYVG